MNGTPVHKTAATEAPGRPLVIVRSDAGKARTMQEQNSHTRAAR
jgi:hypothetical protein